MAELDYYAVLGVLPDAEDVVIAAAYRALAKRYHPDQWKGDPRHAHQRMTEFNQAYAVLGDAVCRAEYDQSRAPSHPPAFKTDDTDEPSQAFTAALQEKEDCWKMACRNYPDLIDLRTRLAQISTQQAFAFVTVMLETRDFKHRAQIAAHLEQVCLARYFGTHESILDYARFLLFSGDRKSAKVLNRFVSSMGANVDPRMLILRVEKELSILRGGDFI